MLIWSAMFLGLVSINLPLRERGEPLNQVSGFAKAENQARPHQPVNLSLISFNAKAIRAEMCLN